MNCGDKGLGIARFRLMLLVLGRKDIFKIFGDTYLGICEFSVVVFDICNKIFYDFEFMTIKFGK